MTIEDDLRPEGWMSTHPHRDMSPLWVHDVEVIVIDVGVSASQVLNSSIFAFLHMPSWGRGSAYQNQKQPFEFWVCWQMFLCNLMFSCPSFAVNDRYPMFLTVGSYTTTESSRHSHQMFIVQIFITPMQVTPPQAKTSRNVPSPKIGIQDDAVRAIVNPIQQFSVILAQVVYHLFRSFNRLWSNFTVLSFARKGFIS
jgi:hypothetical protein